MRKHNYRMAQAKAIAENEGNQARICQICGFKSKNCICKDDEIGHTVYCVCPNCYMWSNEPLARQARYDKNMSKTKRVQKNGRQIATGYKQIGQGS